MSECKCNLREKLLGDGCEECNPANALRYAKKTMGELENHRNMLSEELRRLYESLEPTYCLSPEGRAELERIEKALNYDV